MAESRQMADKESSSRKVVEEFFYLQDRCSAHFAGLRELPAFGKTFAGFFQKTFESYTRLWKFQQTHRAALEAHNCLKRWEIGDIASHIGQVYYHYYLRTADRSYLAESAVFYEAIQQRKYFKELMASSNEDECRRVLRYFARYIMVLLLQQRFDKVVSLLAELHSHVQRYISLMSPPDAQDWLAVVRELRVFCHTCIPAAPGCHIGPGNLQLQIANTVTLQQCVLIGSQTHQIKFSELTLDFLRVMRSLEREEPESEPTVNRAALKSSAAISVGSWGAPAVAKNPVKHLLYRPLVSNALSQLTGCVRELGHGGALLVYICADGFSSITAPDGPWNGGALMAGSARPGYGRKTDPGLHTLCAGDLIPLTRRPLLVICEGECAPRFSSLHSPFGAPLVALLAPEKSMPGMDGIRSSVVSPTFVSDQFGDANKGAADAFGNLFTLFLTDPVTAIVRLCKIATADWPEARVVRSRAIVLECLRQSVKQCSQVPTWSAFCGDEFMSLFVAKFCLCRSLLMRHKDIPRSKEHWPACVPELPASAEPTESLLGTLFKEMGVESQFLH